MGKGINWNRARAKRPSESVSGGLPLGDGYAKPYREPPDKAALTRLAAEALARGEVSVKRLPAVTRDDGHD